MKRSLVTGGAGFLGSHLCDRLIARGDEVICIDNSFTGHRRSIEHLLQHPRFERRPPRSTAIPSYIPRTRATGAT